MCVGGGALIKLFVMGCLWGVLLSVAVVGVLCRWAKFVAFGCLWDLGAPLHEPMC